MEEKLFEPKGIRFYEILSEREMILIDKDSKLFPGWVCYKNPNGQWVTLQKATKEQRERIELMQAWFESEKGR